MGWQPPQDQDLETLRWLGKAGVFAAMVNFLRQFVDSESRYTWWQKILYSLLVGLLSIGMGAMMISIWPYMSFLLLLGIASMGGYLGTDFIVWVSFRALRSRRDDENR